MSTLDDLLRNLATVVGKLDAGNEHIGAAFLSCEEGQQALAQVFEGATAPEVDDALGSLAMALRELAEIRGTVTAVGKRVTAYSSRLGPPSSGGEVFSSSPPGHSAPSKRPPDAVGVDGSRYPPDAAWATPELPARVQQKGDRTVGKIKIGERPIPGAFHSDQSDVWVQQARKRIKTLGIRAWPYVPFHVEIRAAAMMVHSGVTSAEIVINNVPCGYQSRPPGCHQVLEPFLPEGSHVTVSGTDRKGRPYRRTYHGKAKR